MSMFGDGTPLQELYDWVEMVRSDFKLTDDEMIVLLSTLLNHYIDPFQDKKCSIQLVRK